MIVMIVIASTISITILQLGSCWDHADDTIVIAMAVMVTMTRYSTMSTAIVIIIPLSSHHQPLITNITVKHLKMVLYVSSCYEPTDVPSNLS